MFNIKHLKNENNLYTVINSTFEDRLDDLSRVNILVGANNSGKSRFMRSLFYIDKNAKLNFLPNDEHFEYYLNQVEEFKYYINNPGNKQFYNEEVQAYRNINNDLNDVEYLVESQEFNPKLIQINKNINISGKPVNSYWFFCDKIFKEHFKNITFDENLFNYNFYKIYIPSLRGLIPLISKDYDDSNEDVYAKRIKDDYFGEKSNILVDVNDFLLNDDVKSRNAIISGMKFYEYVQNYLLGDLEQRDMIRDYEIYLSQTFFDNKKVVLIPKVNDDVLTVRIGEEEFKIYDLGEGIQSIILITLPLFLYLEKSKEENTNVLVFIEEPEIGLHPRLQRILIETLLDTRFENYQFFFTTHSNHFLDKLFEKEDISIYSFDKSFDDEESKTMFTIEKVGFDHMPTLKKLGALPSSVLANNCTILVEGSYDVVHYRFYLDLYQKKLINENPNITKFEYGTHYSFLRGGGKETANTIRDFNKIQQERIFTVLDKDSNEDYIKNKTAFDKMGYKNYFILEVIEVENLISKEVLIKILNSLREVKKLGISEQFNEEDYQKSNFYKFIKESIITGNIPEGFFNKSTFKERFSYKEQEFVDSFDDLSDAAKEVTKKIYQFIKKSNLLSNDSN